MYEYDWTWGRKSDEFGPLKYLKLIEWRWAEFPPTTFYNELQAAQKVAKIQYYILINKLKYNGYFYINQLDSRRINFDVIVSFRTFV